MEEIDQLDLKKYTAKLLTESIGSYDYEFCL